MSFSIVIDLEPPTPLFTAPARQVQGLPIVFLLVEDGGNIKIGQVAGLRIVWTRRALQPLSQLLLGTILAKIMKEGPSLFITMFIFKDRRHSLAAEADTIPQVGISGIAFEAPDEHSGWYMAHIFAPDFLADLSSMEDHAPHNKDSGGRFMYRRCRGIAGGPSISEPETGVPANGDNDHALPAPASTPQATPGNPPGLRVDRPLMWTTPREMWTTLRPLWTKRRSRRGCGVLQSWNWPPRSPHTRRCGPLWSTNRSAPSAGRAATHPWPTCRGWSGCPRSIVAASNTSSIQGRRCTCCWTRACAGALGRDPDTFRERFFQALLVNSIAWPITKIAAIQTAMHIAMITLSPISIRKPAANRSKSVSLPGNRRGSTEMQMTPRAIDTAAKNEFISRFLRASQISRASMPSGSFAILYSSQAMYGTMRRRLSARMIVQSPLLIMLLLTARITSIASTPILENAN